MINKILKAIEEHIVLDKDLQKVLKAEYPYKEILASDIDDLFALYFVSQQRELLAKYTIWQGEYYRRESDMYNDIDKFLNS